MYSSDLINWINLNLISNSKLVSKKCKKQWFDTYKFNDKYLDILNHTSFLNNSNPTFPQRIWHIINNQIDFYKCQNPNCKNVTNFLTFTKGYIRTCSKSCAQLDLQTIDKIKKTNNQKYGTDYGLGNKDIISKRNKTVKDKYGVDNVSQLIEVSDKKKQTCLKNYGVEWILKDSMIRKNGMIEKYGVDNNTKRIEIREKYSKERKDQFYDSLFSTDRLKGKIIPLFSKEEYNGVGLDYRFKCIKCVNEFSDKLEDGDIPRCKVCYPVKGSSLFEKEITEYIKNILPNEKVIENDKLVLNGKELDIYIPSKNVAIECNGLYWHGELNGGKKRNYHLNKTDSCEKINVHLVHIFEDEWIDNEEIVKSKLSHILNVAKNTNKCYARCCEIKEISVKEKNDFLHKYHIQGDDFSNVKLGAYYKNELVAVMTFGKPRIAMGHKKHIDGQYELIRFATSRNVTGVGSKLLSHFIKTYKPLKILSYADRRWTKMSNNVYEKLGFTKISNGTPNYWYVPKRNIKRLYRYKFRKQVLNTVLENFNPYLSEWENMKNNGYDRIWDCGSIKFELNLN